jgi:cytochrome bd-type quinol oxidase subunit 2
MATFWFWTVVAMLAAYATLDGFDLGAGIIYLLVARTDAETPCSASLDRPGVGW